MSMISQKNQRGLYGEKSCRRGAISGSAMRVVIASASESAFGGLMRSRERQSMIPVTIGVPIGNTSNSAEAKSL